MYLNMAQATCRIPPVLDDALDSAANEVGLYRSDLLKRALLHYITQNPDGLEVFASDDVADGLRLLGGGNISPTSDPPNYDPLWEL